MIEPLPSLPRRHDTFVRADTFLMYISVCSCGWAEFNSRSEKDAWFRCDQHLIEVLAT